MGSEKKDMFPQMIKFVMMILLLLHGVVHINGVNGDHPQVPCFFIFGDSLSDNGNNNQLQTMSKANYKPYGIDFPAGTPTGRFTNGQTSVDILGQLLGFDDFIPPFANTTGYDILKGVNYASGSGGILRESGKHLGECISLHKQLNNHKSTISKIKNRVDLAQNHLKMCLYYVSIGNNDYLQNYLIPKFYNTSLLYTPQQYAGLLIKQYEEQILRLINYGARKVAMIGIRSLGCCPFVISSFGTNGSKCVEKVNQQVQLFNQNLKSLVHKLNTKFSDAKFIYVNTFQTQFGDLSSSGLSNLNESCCPTTNIGLCIPSSTPCENRTSHMFWDNVHPTEALNQITANRSYISHLASDNYPIDIKQLAQLPL
ncbi:GDSL esterase/lipase At1g29660-like isoform X1 [Humulus lupulus]|uniref:GDSL esterase/lipase At1g29660-like isoform X1 n=1 Tax=Humulus lupulus TaxID=3486 RepID=UPI002B411B67|nr:GDSL esterase/lipase At1g29660-like isoform X1 [Humulus lupulus]